MKIVKKIVSILASEEKRMSHSPNAIDLLKADHREVEGLFAKFNGASDRRVKSGLAKEICAALEIHAKIEEKLFYPAAEQKAKAAKDDVKEGFVEHEGIKRLVKQISGLTASDDYFETRMMVLEEYVKHHVKEEETSMFPNIEKSNLDLQELGEQLAARKARLQNAPSMRKSAKTKR